MASGRARRLGATAGGLGLLAGGMAGCGGSTPLPGATVSAYLSAWSAGRYPAMAALVARPPADFAAVNRSVLSQLHATGATYRAGPAAGRGDTMSVPVTSHLTLAGLGAVDLHSTLVLHLTGSRWLVRWTPATVVAGLVAGDHLSILATWPSRAPVLGAGGAVLTPSTQTVTVGVVGSRLRDPAGVSAALVAAGFAPAKVAGAVQAAATNPGAFQTVATISQDRYAQIAGTVYALPGTSFTATDTEKTITPDLAVHVVGRVAPITAQQLQVLGPLYGPTAMVGSGGIEAAYERQLAGTPAVTITLVDGGGRTVATPADRPPQPVRPVQTSIDPTVEAAAEQAMNSVSQQSALVVIRPSTGEVLAAVSRPTSDSSNLAFEAEVPPGSTFKVMTTDALLASGLSPSATLTCPPSITVDGRTFHNDAGEATPTLSFAQAFAVSCNTAFIGASEHLAGQDLTTAALLFGVGVPPRPGLPAYGGKVPSPASAAELAASSIGQGQITVSPLAMATVAATAATGNLHLPRLVAGAPDDTAPPAAPVAPAIIATLHSFMLGVEAPGGTAAPAGLPPGTYGKTGTAEYGTGPNPPAHAWYIGFRGDLAFAVFVNNGVGGNVAAPVAAKLLGALPGN